MKTLYPYTGALKLQMKTTAIFLFRYIVMPPNRHSERIGTRTVTGYVGKGKKRRKITRRVPVYRYWTTPNLRKGTETYIWGAHKNEDKEIAVRENAPIMQEENYK